MEKSSRKHILFLARWYPHRYDPMYGLFVERHARAAALYNDVSVIYVHPDPHISKSFSEVHEEQHFREIKYYVPVAGKALRWQNPIRYYVALKRAWKKLQETAGEPDVIHVNILTRPGIFAWRMKATRGIPYIITEHWSRYQPQHNNFKGFIRKWLTRRVVNNAWSLTTVSADLRRAMENHGLYNAHPEVVPNVVDVDFFRPASQKPVKSKTVFMHLSCFEEKSKNMAGILHAAKKLSLQRDDFIIYMVGDGIDLEKTRKLAKELGLKDEVVFFTGLQEGEALLDKMHRADAMLLFSRYENLPVVILEAFACGLPVISSDVGGISEHLTPSRGILVPPLDENALVVAMDTMIDDKEKYDKEALRRYAVDHFSMQVIGKQFDMIYAQAMQAHD